MLLEIDASPRLEQRLPQISDLREALADVVKTEIFDADALFHLTPRHRCRHRRPRPRPHGVDRSQRASPRILVVVHEHPALRTLRDRALVAVTPRLASKIATDERPLPIGAESWKTSRIFLPAELPAGPYRNLLTGELVQPLEREGERWLFVGDVLRTSPVAMMVNE